MPEPLRNSGNIRDELDIINGKVTIIRRIGNDGSVLAKEVIEEYDDINLETFDKDTYIYIREYPNVEYFCRYVIDNDYLDTFATQSELQETTVELNSLIEQKQDEITLLVSQKVGRDEIIARINLTHEKAKIFAKFLELEGYTTINGGFKIDENGNMEAINGIFRGGFIDLIKQDSQNGMLNACFQVRDGNEYCQIMPNYMVMFEDYSKGREAPYFEILSREITLFDSINQYCTVTSNGIFTVGTARANNFSNNSKAELKENINKLNVNALNMINKTDIYKFNYKNDKQRKCIGLVIGEGYKTPEEVVSNNEAVDLYSMTSISWKAIQELDQKVEKIVNILKKIPILGRIIIKRWKK